MNKIDEIRERLSKELSVHDYWQYRISDIAKLKLDAKHLLAEVDRLTAENDALNEHLEHLSNGGKLEIVANVPLDIEDLKKMDSEPVYCVDGAGHRAWCVVNANNGDCIDSEAGAWVFAFYNMANNDGKGLHPIGWVAYRRKPEEGEK